jgi:hypothetical protein
MEPSRGSITPHRLFSVKDLGLGNPEPHVDLVINLRIRSAAPGIHGG